MNAQEYLQERLEDQISWYDQKSRSNQWWYKRLRLLEIVAAALIPFLSAYVSEMPVMQISVALLGVSIAVIAGSLGLFQFQERWIEYRAACETLKQEKYLFLTSAQPFEGGQEENFQLLVQRVEGLLRSEVSDWRKDRKQGAAETGRQTGKPFDPAGDL